MGVLVWLSGGTMVSMNPQQRFVSADLGVSVQMHGWVYVI